MTIHRQSRMYFVGFLLLFLQIALAADNGFCRGETQDGECVPDPANSAAPDSDCPYFEVKYESIEHFLNPDIFQNPEKVEAIASSLQNGELVVIKNAFLPEYAEAMHCELDKSTAWTHESGYDMDGFHYSHHNVYDRAQFTQLWNASYDMFEHPETKAWIQNLSKRDCSGDSAGSGGTPSYYMPGDHSLPHTDHIYQRTVAYIWHLTKNWTNEWGGALFWNHEHAEHAYSHASFNTLCLFSVHCNTPHFVTTVSRHATEKRLAFNGWWTSSWYPSVEDDLEAMISTPEQRWDLTGTQIDMLQDIVYENYDGALDEERRSKLLELLATMDEELWIPPTNLVEIEY